MTLKDLESLHDAACQVIFVHPDSKEHPLVQKMNRDGYEIDCREVMPKNRAFMSDAATHTLIDLDSYGMLVTTKNTSLDWAWKPDFSKWYKTHDV